MELNRAFFRQKHGYAKLLGIVLGIGLFILLIQDWNYLDDYCRHLAPAMIIYLVMNITFFFRHLFSYADLKEVELVCAFGWAVYLIDKLLDLSIAEIKFFRIHAKDAFIFGLFITVIVVAMILLLVWEVLLLSTGAIRGSSEAGEEFPTYHSSAGVKEESIELGSLSLNLKEATFADKKVDTNHSKK